MSVSSGSEFDSYSENYEEALQRGLSVSGENAAYFARRRVAWLGRCLAERHYQPASVLDFGCGTGTATPYLLELLGAERVVGVDVSAGSLGVARRDHSSDRIHFLTSQDLDSAARFDLVYCNGVFHHVPLDERGEVVAYILRVLRPGGLLALWENNPWSPGARYVMARIPFDRDAKMISARGARRLLRAGGFAALRTDYLFIFPRALGLLRPLEAPLARLPCGAQYQVLASKSIDAA
jgi:SAM-dependent methyltransferase